MRALPLLLLLASFGAQAAPVDIGTVTVPELQNAMAAGTLTSEALTKAFLARVAAFDQQGPTINTVIRLNERALDEARTLDVERKAGKLRGPLHGIPVVLKDNIDAVGLPTTAGSALLKGNLPPDDAFIVKRLREAGAIVLAKLNLSEFAAGGGSTGGSRDVEVLKLGAVPNGYSSMGGQTRNPHDLTRGPSGSSGGTGAAIAAAFAAFGVGTDTHSSVRGPSSVNGIVGLKPTNGLMSRDGIVPLALSLDTAGPMARNVTDVAVALGVMAGVDSADAMTTRAEGHIERDYTTFLKKGSLKGRRVGVSRDFNGQNAGADAVFEQAVAALRKLGATVIDVSYPEYLLLSKDGIYFAIAQSEFRQQIPDYLKTTGPNYPKTLDDLVRLANDPATGYPDARKAFALKYTASVAMDADDPRFVTARDQGMALIRAGVDAVMTKDRLDTLVTLSSPAAATLIAPPADPKPSSPRALAYNIANLSGYPEIVVPAGMTPAGLPVTISFLGRAFSDGLLLGLAYDFEQSTHALRLPRFTPPLASDRVGR